MDTNQPIATIEEVMRLQQQGDFKNALSGCRQLLADQPDHPMATHLLGLIQCQMGAMDEGFEALQRSLMLDPKNARFHSNVAGVLGRLKRYKDSLPYLRIATELEPGFMPAQLNLGATLENLGDKKAAEVVYRRILEKTPDHRHARYRLCCVLFQTDRYDESERIHLDLFGLNPPPAVEPDAFPALTHPRVVVVVTCKGRLEHLKQTLPQMLNFDFPAELPDYRVVMVDYGDPENSFDWCRSLAHPRLVAIRVLDNTEIFQKSRAFNCGANVLPSDILTFVDADSVLDRTFLSHVTEIVSRPGVVLSRRETTDQIGDTVGVCCMRTAAYRAARGYDEALHGHGPEDIDIFARVGQYGTTIKFPGHLYPRAIRHSRTMRTKFHTVKDEVKNATISLGRLYDSGRKVNDNGYGRAEIKRAYDDTGFIMQCVEIHETI